MTLLMLQADDWARIRFTRSLLWETGQAVRTLVHRRQQLHHRAWLNTVDEVGARARLPVLVALNPAAGWVADFIAPPPQPGDRSIDDELADVAAYLLGSVAADVHRSLHSHPTRTRRAVLEPLIDDPDAAITQIVAELRWAWTGLIAPFWSPVHGLIGADVAYRSREIARVGMGQVLDDLHPSVTWQDGVITVDHSDSITIDLGGRGLALMPSAFAWPDLIVVHDPPWSPTLVYPARGVGDLWTAPPAPSTGLAGVLGHIRALLLTDLRQPATTTALAGRHHLSPAAVSTQLGRLRDAGLVASHRTGKEVHYQRTPAADTLVNARPATRAGP